MERSEVKVIKHSAAVGVVGCVTLLQRRAWNVLLALAYDELPSRERFSVSMSELIDRLSITTRNTEHMKSVLTGLVETRMEWDALGRDRKRKWGTMPMLAEARIEEGTVHYAFPPTLRDWLYNPTVYARISLSISNRFNSRFALATYELAVDYLGVGESPWIELLAFRRLMGVEEGQYEGFRELNRNVIRVAESEINDKSDIALSFEMQRQGRKVVALKLRMKAVKETPAARVEAEKAAGRALAQHPLPVTYEPDAFDHWLSALPPLERLAFEARANSIVDREHPTAKALSRPAFVGMTMRELWHHEVRGLSAEPHELLLQKPTLQ